MLLPVIANSENPPFIQAFNPKLIKVGEIVGKVYSFKNAQIP